MTHADTSYAVEGHNSGEINATHLRAEEWRAILGYECEYEVSNNGRVRCVTKRRYFAPGHLIALTLANNGYLHVCLNRKPHSVHRLVCESFHGMPPSKSFVAAHYNGVRTDNREENLRWATYSENNKDMDRHGTRFFPRGGKQGGAKLTESDVIEIRRLRSAGVFQRDVAQTFGVSRGAISNIDQKINWRHL